jgi:hypothetical protein
MSTRESVDWHLAGWAAGLLAFVALGTYLLSVDQYGRGIRAEVGWPNKLSWRQSVDLPVTAENDDRDPVAGASVELGRLPAPTPDGSGPARFGGVRYGRADELAEVIDEFTVLTTAETDEYGRTWLEVPPARELLDRELDDDDPRSVTLVARVRQDGAATYRFADLPLQKRARLALTTDRPLYQPGDTVRLRGLALDASTGGPYTPATTESGAAARLEIVGPTGATLLRENPLVSDRGVVDQTFQLADEPRHGTYRATLSLARTETTRTFEVRPYEKPNFEVSLETRMVGSDAAPEITGTLSARYIYGEPIAGGTVAIRPTDADDRGPILEASLDGDGEYDFEIRDQSSASRLLESGLTARVTSPSGRSRQVTRRLRADASALQVDLYPHDATRFRAERETPTVVSIRGPDGRPVEDARVSIRQPETDTPVASDLRTDADGRATFDWTPDQRWTDDRRDRSLHVTIDRPTGPKSTHEIDPLIGDRKTTRVTPATPTPRVGESLDFELDIVGRSYIAGERVPVFALHDGVPVATTEVARSSGDLPSETVEGSIELDRRARGLTYLLALDHNSEIAGWTALWVRSADDSGVDIDVAGDDHRPGEKATVSVTDRAGGPTTFGVWAVDEALYELEQRADLPLSSLLHQEADVAEAAARARRSLGPDGDLQTDTPSGMQAATALNNAAGPPRLSSELVGGPLDRALDEERRAPWAIVWAFFLLALGVALLAYATWTVWREFDFDRVGGGRLFGSLVGPVALSGGWILLAFAIREPSVYLYFTVGGCALVGALLDAVFGTRDFAYGRWLGAIALLCGLGFALVVSFQFVPYYHDSILPDLLKFVVLGGILLLAANLVGWCAIFWTDERHLSLLHSLVLATLPLLGTTSLFFIQKQESRLTRARQSAPPDGEPDSRLDRSAPDDTPEARDEFPDTMLWRPEVRADDGTAELDIDLPDSITTWRLQAIAHGDDGRIGHGTATLAVDQPFFARVDLPSELRRGDTLEVPVSLVDNRDAPDAPLTVDLEVDATGSLTSRASRTGIEISAGKRRIVRIDVSADATGPGELTVRATPSGAANAEPPEADAVARSTRVVAPGRHRSDAISGTVGDGWEARADIPDEAEAARAHLDIVPPGVGVALDGVDSMLERPHGCFEQTTSAAFPNAAILGALDAVGPEDWSGGADAWHELRDRVERLVQQGYQRLLRFQTDEGGFGPYHHHAAEIGITAFGLLQIAMMEAALDDLPANRTLQAATKWLADRQRPDGTWSGRRTSDLQTTALALWALGASPAADDSIAAEAVDGLDHLLETDEAGPLARALAANAYLAADEHERARELVDDMANTAEREGRESYWETTDIAWTGERDDLADLLATTLAARAMHHLETHPELLRNATNYLATERSHEGGWPTTQTTVWAVDLYGDLASGDAEPTRLEATADGEPLARPGSEPDGSVRVIPGRSTRTRLGPRELAAGSHTFSVSPDRQTDTLAQVTAEYTVPWDHPAARPDDAALDLDIETDTDETTTGTPLPVEVTVTNTRDTRLGPTVVRLPIPPGGRATTTSLDRRRDNDTLDRLEQTPTHLVAYLPGFAPEASTSLAYEVIPQIRGDFRLPPATAYPYYNPHPQAAAPGGELRVD